MQLLFNTRTRHRHTDDGRWHKRCLSPPSPTSIASACLSPLTNVSPRSSTDGRSLMLTPVPSRIIHTRAAAAAFPDCVPGRRQPPPILSLVTTFRQSPLLLLPSFSRLPSLVSLSLPLIPDAASFFHLIFRVLPLRLSLPHTVMTVTRAVTGAG